MQENPASQAFHILDGMRTAALQNAAALPRKEDVASPWQGLGFTLGGVRLVAHTQVVSEVLQLPRLTPLPGVKAWVLGVGNIRGRLLPVVDLRVFFDQPSTAPASHARVLVVELPDIVAGLVVESAQGFQQFLDEAFEPGVGADIEGFGRFVKGGFRHEGRLFHEIDLQSVLRDEQFLDVALSEQESGLDPLGASR